MTSVATAAAGAAFLSLSLCGAASAQDSIRGADLDKLRHEPGTEILTSKDANGDKVVEIHRGGVTITQTTNPSLGIVNTFGLDDSGKGAVLCSWQITASVRQALRVCYPHSRRELHSELDHEIGDMARFIATNSLTPTSTQQVLADQEERDALFAKQVAQNSPERIAAACKAGAFSQMLSSLIQHDNPALRREMRRLSEESLSVPRPPVGNPCF